LAGHPHPSTPPQPLSTWRAEIMGPAGCSPNRSVRLLRARGAGQGRGAQWGARRTGGCGLPAQPEDGESTDVVVSLSRQRGQRAHCRHRGGRAAAESSTPSTTWSRRSWPPTRTGGRPWHGAADRHEQGQDRPITAGGLPARRARTTQRRMVRVSRSCRPVSTTWPGRIPRRRHRARGPDREEGVRVVDEFELPVPAESGDYDDPAVRGPERATLKPIEITSRRAKLHG